MNTVPDYLRHIRIVFEPHQPPSQYCAAARAMKTMGLSQLVLVAPNIMATPMTPEPPKFIAEQAEQFVLPEESFILASGAVDVLETPKLLPLCPKPCRVRF